MKSAAATNAKLSASLELFQTLDCEDVRIIRSDRVMLRINQKNALAYAAKFKNAHKTFPRGAYKRIKPERAFPRFAPGMSTQEYVLLFAFKNSSSSCHVLPIDFDALGDRPAALYENGALDFDVIEEPNEDYFTTQAAQDVAQVLATAQAMAAFEQASTPAQAQSQPEAGELVTCESGDSEAQSPAMGNAGTWAPAPQYIPPSVVHINAGQPTQPAFRGGNDSTKDTSHLVALMQRRDTERDRLAMATSDTERAARLAIVGKCTNEIEGEFKFLGIAPTVDTLKVDEAELMASLAGDDTGGQVSDTLETFEDGDGVSFELCDAINRATVAQVQGLTDAQFSKLYDHLENWNFHTENYLIEALRFGDASIISGLREVLADQKDAGYLRGDVYDRRIEITTRLYAAKQAQADAVAASQVQSQAASKEATAPKAYKFRPGAQVQKLQSKSGKWLAQFRMSGCGLFELGFKRINHGPAASTTYATTRERMAALQAMARAADAPTDTPTPPAPPAADFEPAGDLGQPAAPEQAPTVPQSETPQDVGGNQAEAVGADFERIEPIRVDLAALIIKGVRPDDLVGMGVYCSGDRANPSGSGAITGFSHSDFYGLVVDVTLESGQVWRKVRTSEFKDGWFSLNAKMHGAPYLAELAMGATLAKSKDTSAKELAKQAHAQALIDLAAQFPQLKRAESTYAGGKLAAVNMRVLLKAAFKGVKFSVTSTYSSARIVWTDGPTDAQVQTVIGRFDIGASDTQSDYFYTVATAFSQLFGGVQYLTTRREETDALIQEAIDKAFINSMEKPALADWKTGKNEMSWGDWKRRRVQEALNTISKA